MSGLSPDKYINNIINFSARTSVNYTQGGGIKPISFKYSKPLAGANGIDLQFILFFKFYSTTSYIYPYSTVIYSYFKYMYESSLCKAYITLIHYISIYPEVSSLYCYSFFNTVQIFLSLNIIYT
jgi:hypothetical protein